MTDLSGGERGLRRGGEYADTSVRDAVRTGVGFAAAGFAFLLIAAVWVGTCTGQTADAVACGPPQRAVLAMGAPAILLIGGVWSLARSLRFRRDQSAWGAWLASGWSLLALTVLSAVLSLPSLPGR